MLGEMPDQDAEVGYIVIRIASGQFISVPEFRIDEEEVIGYRQDDLLDDGVIDNINTGGTTCRRYVGSKLWFGHVCSSMLPQVDRRHCPN